ncbi:MAG: Ig-like domain repeat protein [Thermoleophilia bacterium]|nr:Ig-like domain repeat protein [Thermoleophilia bacterium]
MSSTDLPRTRPPRRARRRLQHALLVAALLLASCAAWSSSTAAAATYWWSGVPSPGSNGFAWSNADAPYWNPWGAYPRCESRGTTIPAGNPCIMTWHVPAGLDARSGSLTGTYKQSNPAFEQRMTVECNGTTVLQGTSTIQSFTRSWPDMCNYLSVDLLSPSSAVTVSNASQFFELSGFTIELVDPSAPVIAALDGHAGWHGTGGACVHYAFSESGSGLVAASLANVSTGQTYDAPTWGGGGIVTGVGSVDRRPCFAAPGASGTYTLRASATDKAGNVASTDAAIAFDVTAPTLGAPTIDGGAFAEGAVRRGSAGAGAYRPTFAIAASDAHSGLADVTVLLDGAAVAHATSWQPASDLAPGDHVVTFRATDAVGNAASVARTVTVVDDVAPTISIADPGASGGSEPVLDVSAADDLAGIEPTTWTVRVNGQVLAASSATWRLQAEIGWLVDGTHEISVSIADQAGNVATERVSYTADSGDGEPDPPGLTGLYLMQSPDRVEEGGTYRVRAIAVAAGRPVAGTYELRDGADVIASGDAAVNGQVEIDATISVPGPLVLHPPVGSGLDPVQVAYAFVPTPVDPCIASPLDPACTGGGGDDGAGGAGTGGGAGGAGGGSGAGGGQSTSTTTIIQVPVPVAAGAQPSSAAAGGGAPGSADGQAPYPKNVVYYVQGVPYWNGLPLAESGAARDRVPPRWRLSVRRERAGSVKRTSRLALRLWTNEMAVVSITPSGATRRFSVNPRRKLRTIHVRIDRRTVLGKRIARAKAGQWIVVKLRVVATDKNENASRPRTVRLRIRV